MNKYICIIINRNRIIAPTMYFNTYVYRGWSQEHRPAKYMTPKAVSFPFNLLARSSLNWPKRMERNHIGAFEFEGDSFSCTASDGLGLYAALRSYMFELGVHSEGGPDADVAKSFLTLMDLIELLHMSMRDAVDAGRLETLTQTYLKRFVKAHGHEPVVPKHHLMLHLGKCLRDQKFILSCFCHERRHKEIKRYGDNLHNTGPWFDRKILEELRQQRYVTCFY